MNPRTLMTVSALLLGGLGLGLVFAPAELAGPLGLGGPGSERALGLAGGALAAFGLLNWMGRGAIYGGIYGRPITLANFFVGVMGSFVALDADPGVGRWVLLALFGVQTLGFGRLLFGRVEPSGGPD